MLVEPDQLLNERGGFTEPCETHFDTVCKRDSPDPGFVIRLLSEGAEIKQIALSVRAN